MWGLSLTALLHLFTWALCFAEVATTETRKEEAQPYWSSNNLSDSPFVLHPSPSVMGERGAKRKQGLGCWHGVRGSSDAGAAVPGQQGEWKTASQRLTHTNLGTVLLKQGLASPAPLVVPWLVFPVFWAQESEEAMLLLSMLNNSHSSAVSHKHPSPNAFTGFWHKFVITQLYLIRFWKKMCLEFTIAFGFFIKQYTYVCIFLLLTYYCVWKLILGKDQHGIVESHSVLKRINLSSSGRQSTVQPWQGAMVTIHLGKHIQKHHLEEHTGVFFNLSLKKKKSNKWLQSAHHPGNQPHHKTLGSSIKPFM